MQRLLFSIIFLQLILPCIGQGVYVPPKIPEKSAKALTAAVSSAAVGNAEKSIAEISELIIKYPTWTEPRQHLSRLFYEQGMKKESVKTLEESLAIDTLSQIPQLYTLGRLYEETGEFEKSLKAYRVIIEKGIHQQGLAQRATASLKALEEKSRLFKSDYSIKLAPLSEGINTEGHEAMGRWTIDGQEIIFTRLVDNQEDLFLGRFNSGKLKMVEEFPFNTPNNEGGHAISPDGKYLVFTSCDRPDGLGSCDLYLSVLKGGEWSTPVNMGSGFNSPSWDSQPAFGLDGLSIYFTSTRPGGSGGSDIWMVREESRGKWSKPINVGPGINTANNESSPFIHFDGRTMYLMRDGKEGLGGYDLYIAHQDINGKWKQAENMRSPINSGSDEGALAVHPNGKRALITRLTTDRKNELFEFELPIPFRSTSVQVLYVRVIDQTTKKPIRAQLELFDVNGGDTIRASQWGDENGNITMSLDQNKSYGLIASAEGYIMHSSNLSEDTSSIRRLDIGMNALTEVIDKPMVLQNIFFETASAKLLSNSETELNKLLWTLRKNEQMKIEIRGHTDNVGTDDYNLQLSSERARSVYQYLIDRGIMADRLSYVGHGKKQPIATNDTEIGRKQNRRTEFVIRGRID